ncbi:MAG: LysE family transporter [Myxococcota bacterium]
MLLAALVGYVAAFIASMPVAGPVAALIVRNAVEGRARSAIGLAVGTGLAEGIYALLAMLGSTMLDDFPIVIPISKCLAAVLLIVLGIQFSRFVPTTPGLEDRGGGGGGGDAEPVVDPRQSRRHHTIQSLDVAEVMKKARSTERPWKSFTVGFSLTALNPTLLATWTAAATMIQGRKLFPVDVPHSVPFSIGVILGAFSWFGVLVWLLSRYRHRFSPLTLQRVIRWMGVGLIVLGSYFFVEFIVWITKN